MKFLLTFIFVFFSICVFAGEVDIEIPKSKKPVKQGVVTEFSDAVVIDHFNTQNYLFEGEPKTQLYLKYDDNNLYALFICYENQKGYPKAFNREENLMIDDAVQIVLGLSAEESARGSLNMGGYEGAYSEISPCDFYYQFTVNSENSKTRDYLEMHLDRPLFDSKIKKENNRWLALMTIPFKSWGVKKPDGLSFYFNAYRSRPPETFGYKNYSYGGYRPMSFARAKFTSEPSLNNTFTQKETKKENIIDDFSLRYYPTAKQICSQALMSNTNQNFYLIMESDKFETIKNEIKAGKQTNLAFNIGDNPNLPINVKAKIISSAGTVLKEDSLTVESTPEMPEYLNFEFGEGIIPKPWTKPVIKGNTIKLLNKDIVIGKGGFFASVTGKGELLAGDMNLIININGKPVPLELINQDIKEYGRGVLVTSKYKCHNGTFDIKLKIDFDGFTQVKMRSADIEPDILSKLSLNVPLKRENALFVNRSNVQRTVKIDKFGWHGDCDGYMWVGCHECGLGYEYDQFNSTFAEKKRNNIEIINDKDISLLKLNFIDEKGQIKEKGHVFVFYLTPTPTKDYSLNKHGLYHGVELWFETWSDWQGYFDFAKLPQIKERVENAEKKGNDFAIYFSQCLAEDSPASQLYFNDLTAFPKANMYQRAYENIPGKGVPCYLSCVRELFGDLILYGIDKAVKEAGLSCIYMDGPSLPWACQNPSHNHCDSNVYDIWEDDYLYPYEKTRDFLIKMRNILSQSGKPITMVAHTGGGISPGTMSLCDNFFEGEQVSRYKQGYNIPQNIFSVGYSGTPWGMRHEIIISPNINNDKKLRALCLLHDSTCAPYKDSYDLENKIYKDFQNDKETEFYPYWRKQDKINYEGKSLMTYYLNKDKALVVFGNLTFYNDTIKCDLSKLLGERAVAIDGDDDSIIYDDVKNISFNIAPNHYKILMVYKDKSLVNQTKETIKKNIIKEKQEEYKYENSTTGWKANIGDPGNAGEILDNNITINTTLQKAEGIIEFEKNIDNFFGEFEIERVGPISINIGPSRVLIANKTVKLETVDDWNNGIIISNDFDEITHLNVKLSINNNEMDVIINDKVVCYNVMPKLDKDINKISFRTWADSYIIFKPILVTNNETDLIPQVHPVL
ncbi:MAG: hypothetical protein IJS60_03015 [Abditibacteriota bacterium]|nr:hypothetical protein [Abditibacteriota bacterium]